MTISHRIGLKPEQKIWLCPYSHLSEKLAEILKKQDISIQGFLDQKKTGENIRSYKDFNLKKDERIFIVSPNHALTIYQTLIHQGLPAKALSLIDYVSSAEQPFRLRTELEWRFISSVKAGLLALYKRIHSCLKHHLACNNKALLISPGFVDLNIKDLYIELDKTGSIKPCIATDNLEQIRRLKKFNINTVKLNSPLFLWRALRAKIKVLDHNPVSSWHKLALKDSISIQLWHGIPLKKIGHLSNYKQWHYDMVVSTSPFVTDYAFKPLFSAKRILECGYPRNDILTSTVVQPECQDKRLALVNRPIYDWLIHGKRKFIVYMPTWRQPGSMQNPLNLDDLNRFAKNRDLILIIKHHPFIRPGSFYSCLNEDADSERFHFRGEHSENVLFYPSTDDIYPLLAHSQALITDYSSVYFDYLLVNKPLIFFCYDRMQYVSKHGDFMLDFNTYTPGEKPQNAEELMRAIDNTGKEDRFRNAREKLYRQLFRNETHGKSGQILAGAIASMTDKPRQEQETEALIQ